MTDWNKVFGFEKHTYNQSFPITSFLLVGVSNYKDTINNINIGDILDMDFEPNNIHDTSAIVIKKITDICGYVSKDSNDKVKSYVPSKVKVIDKQRVKNNYSLRVDIIEKEVS
jgi:hypothetical protein